MRLARIHTDFAESPGPLGEAGGTRGQTSPWPPVWPLIVASLLSAIVAGCQRQAEVSAARSQGQVENRPANLSVRTPSPPEIPAKEAVSVSAPATGQLKAGAGSELPLYELRMESKDLKALERDPGSNDTHPATFIADGEIYTNVQVRYRGEWARTWPKKPLKIFFSREKPYQGHHSLNLNSAWRDPGFVRETLAYQVYAACGVPASRSQLVRLHLNGRFHGLYVEVEQVDKTLLRRFDFKGAILFKASSDENQADERDLGSESAFAGHYENETQKTNGLHELQRFCHELALATNTLNFFTRHVEVEKYVNYLAASVLVQHWDSFNKNHFLVYDRPGSGKWFALPWDLDRTLGDHWNHAFDHATLSILLGTRRAPGVTGWNRLQDRFLSEPVFRRRLLERIAHLLETEFTPGKLFPILDGLESQIAAEAALDRQRWGGPNEDLQKGIAGIKRYIERRRTYLQRELKQLQEALPPPELVAPANGSRTQSISR